jgi:hypothetical protein
MPGDDRFNHSPVFAILKPYVVQKIEAPKNPYPAAQEGEKKALPAPAYIQNLS